MSHTNRMFIKYNVVKVKDMLEENHLKFVYKLVHHSLPNYVHDYVSMTRFAVYTQHHSLLS